MEWKLKSRFLAETVDKIGCAAGREGEWHHSTMSRTITYTIHDNYVPHTFQDYSTLSCITGTIPHIWHHSAPSRFIQNRCTPSHTIPDLSASSLTIHTILQHSAQFCMIHRYPIPFRSTWHSPAPPRIILQHFAS